MDLRGRGLRFTAVTAMVVLALTGFSSGRGHGGGGDGGGGGGGCSSSGQNHDSSSSTSGGSSGSGGYDDDDHDTDYDTDYDADTGSGSGSGSSEALQDGTVELVSCATEQNPYATVELTNPHTYGSYFTVTVDFLDASANLVEQRTADEFVAAGETATVQVDLSNGGVAARVAECEAEPYATVE
ncbi:hypothetical protein [Streptomyces sp. NPDC048002]|uniref:hypothetical protein n=1 Tax=unclassified Streptomyces TaxID=2593676 RepID=UPI00340603FA